MIYQNVKNEQTPNEFSSAIRELQIAKLLQKFNIVKSCGISAFEVFQFLLLLVFQGKNLYHFLNSKHNDQTVLNILASRNQHSGILETGVPDTETSIDWLDYPASEMEFLSSPKPLCGALAGFTRMEFLINYGNQSKLTHRFPVTGQQGYIRRNIHVSKNTYSTFPAQITE